MKSNGLFKNRFAGIALFVSVLFLLQSCGPKKLEPIKINPAFAGYVISFTSGIVSNKTKVRVRLVQEVPEAVAGKEISVNPFSFSPNIKGKVAWADKQTIEFTPDELLPSGEIYTVDFELDKFVKVPDSLSTLTFRFQVIKQDMEYEFNGISPYKEMDKKWQQVHGIFRTADFANPALIEQAVKAEGDKEYKLTWTHSADGTEHKFSVDSVERKVSAQIITLKWDGKGIGVDKSETVSIEMPGLNDFKIIHYKAITNPTASVDVFFSDPINKTQDLAGLFSLYPSSELTTIVDGNVVHLIPNSSASGAQTLTVFAGLKNVFNQALGKNYTIRLSFESIKPQVELIGDGVIIPNTKGILFPFKAVSLSAVDVKIIQIFENNIVQFLQVNQLDGDREIKRVGRIVYNQEVSLTSDKPIDYTVWNTFSLDLSKLIEPQPGAIYRVEISFRKKHSLYPCTSSESEAKTEEYVPEKEENSEYDAPNGDWYYYEEEYYYEGEYNWEERDDPCKLSYYNSERAVRRNVLASDIGLIAKAGSNGEYFVAVTDLRTAEPLSGVDLEFRNYQNQVMSSSSTNSEGFCQVKLSGKPFVLVAKEGKQRGYLRLDDASSLSLSMFDVSGEELKKGVKGFIYGERDVWRPGDMMYLTFILEDKNNALPDNHPVVMELYNPEGQLSKRMVKSTNVNGFYNFTTSTPPDAPTGSWSVKMRVGGSTFSRNLRVETVKPNRMKINLTFPSKLIKKGAPTNGKIEVKWLHGAPASNAKVEIDATIAPAKTEFKGYKDYVFDDQTKSFTPSDINIFKGNLNPDGKANVPAKLEVSENTPGMVAVQMKTRAYDAGGDFSVDRFVLNYSPYTAYVGVKTPQGDGWNDAVYCNENTVVPIAYVDQNGKPLNGEVKIEIYNVYWRWWWDQSEEENMADFISNQNANLVHSETVKVSNGRLMYNMKLKENYYGRMLLRVSDPQGGHSTSTVFYSTYKDYWSNAGSDRPGGAEMLLFNTNKKTYNVGEKVEVELPATHKGRALVSIETGSKVLKNFWVDSEDKSKFSFEVTPEMSPNIFIHITFIQPHNHNKNDFPIRMYGVQPVTVYDPQTHITPIITMPKSLKPEQKFRVSVKEAKEQDMTYTIAIVDEGLLDLTRFKTPNPWDAFYTQEALGVRTWDLYKYVAGAFTGKIAGLLAIGGDGYLNKKGKENNNRFKPVVLFSGPLFLKGGKTQIHEFTMPNYVGSVRVMVVAGNKGAYGCAEKAVPVKQALMVLPTLPRVVSPTEIIKVPVTVFAMEKTVKNVTVSLATDRNFEVLDGATRQIVFKKPGDQLVEFQVKVKDRITNGKIVATAVSGKIKSKSETNLKIRMPNPPESRNISAVIKPGQTWSQIINAVGLLGTNSGTIELTNMYPIDLGKRLNFLIQYPHGCIEQTTSSAFPQLFLQYVMELSAQRKAQIETNVKATLERLKTFQVSSGGFTYWPGEGGEADEWGSNYAGHFMLEAKAMGYQLPVGMLDSWINYQNKEANSWTPNFHEYNSDLIQAYRLYTLAMAKKPAMSAMNRMRETANLCATAKWRLAAAYAVAGKPDIAAEIISTVVPEKMDANYYRYSYGSEDRDDAMRLETLVLLKRHAQAKALVTDLAKIVASQEWLSTQSTAYILLAVSKYVGSSSTKKLSFTLNIDGQNVLVNTTRSISQTVLNFSKALRKQLVVKNTSGQNLYLSIALTGVPLMSKKENYVENLGMVVRYFDMKGTTINPLKIKQGTDFYAEVIVTHPGTRSEYANMAIQQMFPSGWEIINTRMDIIENTTIASSDVPRYQDIRDDRVFMYFDLDKGQKKTFRVLLHAAYLGIFYLPSVNCEAMYDNTIHASTNGKWVEVVR